MKLKTATTILNCKGKTLDLHSPRVMGILNLTPDSYYDGGRYLKLEDARQRAREMVAEGAGIIDIGGESTRPGAKTVSLQEELDRVIPVIEIISKEFPVPVSIDTYKPEVMREAVNAGAGFINDVSALRQPNALAVAAQAQVPVCLMHMLGSPATMQVNPHYDNVTQEVKTFLKKRIHDCIEAGIAANNIIIDPGFGFGKTLKHNLTLVNSLNEFTELGAPILVGLSRKSMIEAALGLPVQERLYCSLALATIAFNNGASIIRTHDIKPTVQALAMANIVRQEKNI